MGSHIYLTIITVNSSSSQDGVDIVATTMTSLVSLISETPPLPRTMLAAYAPRVLILDYLRDIQTCSNCLARRIQFCVDNLLSQSDPGAHTDGKVDKEEGERGEKLKKFAEDAFKVIHALFFVVLMRSFVTDTCMQELENGLEEDIEVHDDIVELAMALKQGLDLLVTTADFKEDQSAKKELQDQLKNLLDTAEKSIDILNFLIGYASKLPRSEIVFFCFTSMHSLRYSEDLTPDQNMKLIEYRGIDWMKWNKT